jgi:hypothetical protein
MIDTARLLYALPYLVAEKFRDGIFFSSCFQFCRRIDTSTVCGQKQEK